MTEAAVLSGSSFAPTQHTAMSGDVWLSHYGRERCSWHLVVEAKAAAGHPIVPTTPPPQRMAWLGNTDFGHMSLKRDFALQSGRPNPSRIIVSDQWDVSTGIWGWGMGHGGRGQRRA